MHGLCTKCSKLIPTGLARHHRLAHITCSTCRWQGLKKDFLEHSPCSQRAGTPVEEFACVSEVALPNGRMHHNFSQFGSSKGDVPHILDTAHHETLLLGIDLVWKLTEVLKSDEDVTVSLIQEHNAQALTTGNCSVRSSAIMSATRMPWMHYRPSVSSWTSLQAATTVKTPERWLNVSMGPIMNGPDFELAHRRHICNTYNIDEASVTLHGCDANILPKLAPVDLHHDFTGGICTAAQSNHEDRLLARSSSSGSSGLILTLHICLITTATGTSCLPTLKKWNIYGTIGRRNGVGPAGGTTLHFYCDAPAANAGDGGAVQTGARSSTILYQN